MLAMYMGFPLEIGLDPSPLLQEMVLHQGRTWRSVCRTGLNSEMTGLSMNLSNPADKNIHRVQSIC